GFWSKDEIIKVAFEHSWLTGGVALLGAGITAYYMTRVMLMTFFGKARWADDAHPHESPAVMTIPLVVLAALSAVGGWALLHMLHLESWLEPVLGHGEGELPFSSSLLLPLTLGVVAIGVVAAWRVYGGSAEIPVLTPRGSWFIRAARADLGGDLFNEKVVMQPGQQLTATLVRVDDSVVDGAVRGIGGFIAALSTRLRQAQNGFARSYALVMVIGAIIVALALAMVRFA
ncbi:MAG: NADH-quinone oxidoreductase subunit L, partial [Actinobacteria bacterium]|nr:NADH-quinone oxidoreductase subunit L [Actinomycetota bacterium]